MSTQLDVPIADLTAAVARSSAVADQAIASFATVRQLLADAILAAQLAGATAAQLQAMADLVVSIDAKSAELQAAAIGP